MAMSGLDPTVGTASNYRAWAREAHGLSPAYESLAYAVAEDETVLGLLAGLPTPKRQPNLLFAAARYLLGRAPEIGDLRTLVSRRSGELSQVMLSRRTQTNEPARCATILPALGQLPEPLALIEVGASAGLTLLFDRYSYEYFLNDGDLDLTDDVDRVIAGSDPEAPMLRCEMSGGVPVPLRLPEIVWRAGLDLNPLDVTDDEDMRWLSCLVWPGEGNREQRLAAAIASARRDPPPVYRGDLLADLPALAAQAPSGATLVIFHSAVLAYVAPEDRSRFADTVRDLGAVWLSNEAPGVLPGISVPLARHAPCILVRDGRTPLALACGHGNWLHWLPLPSGAKATLARGRLGRSPLQIHPAGRPLRDLRDRATRSSLTLAAGRESPPRRDGNRRGRSLTLA
jgi:hypothetical protein